MPFDRYRVTATALNLRSEPRARPGNRIAVLPQGQHVQLVEESADPAWWNVQTEFHAQRLAGFVAHRYLVLDEDFTPQPDVHGLSPVHLQEGRAMVTRRATKLWAYPLGEPGRPLADGNHPREHLSRVVDWLQPGHPAHLRYAREGRTTYCNVYAYDYTYLAGVFLPRVWWKQHALESLRRGERVVPAYDLTVREVRANQLFDWLEDFGGGFGWHRVFDATRLQNAANRGGVGLILGQRRQRGASGHISVVIPETDEHHAVRRDQRVTTPLQSEAGWTPLTYSTRNWWRSDRFRDFAFWTNEPAASA